MASVRSTKNSTGIKPGDVSTFQITESTPFRGRVERIDVFASASSVVTLVTNAEQNASFPGSVNRFDPPTFSVPTGDVSTANDAVTVSAHGCVTGDPVKYIKASNPIGGIANGVTYFLIRVDANTFRLATTAANATAGTAITLTSVGVGDSAFQVHPEYVSVRQTVAVDVFLSPVDCTDSDVFPDEANSVAGGGLVPSTDQLQRFFVAQSLNNINIAYQRFSAGGDKPQSMGIGAACDQTFMVVEVSCEHDRGAALVGRSETYLYTDAIDPTSVSRTNAAGDQPLPVNELVALSDISTNTHNSNANLSTLVGRVGQALSFNAGGALNASDTAAQATLGAINTKVTACNTSAIAGTVAVSGNVAVTSAGLKSLDAAVATDQIQVATKANTALAIKNLSANVADAVMVTGQEANGEMLVTGGVTVTNPSGGTPLVVAWDAKEASHCGVIASATVAGGAAVPNSVVDMSSYRGVFICVRYTHDGTAANMPLQITLELSNDNFTNVYSRRLQGGYGTSGASEDSFPGATLPGVTTSSQVYQCLTLEMDATAKKLQFRNTDANAMHDLRIEYTRLP